MANPYAGRPDYQFWKGGRGFERPETFDPVTSTSFKIEPSDAIVTAGSCFAQHIARRLPQNGYRVLVTERAHPLIPDKHAADFYYGVFSARYGNIYTARQLRQLLERSYGAFEPREAAWPLEDSRWVDPFRPQIQPGGFVSIDELLLDREIHFLAVRRAIDEMSIFIFTLGLTEAWVDRADGSVFPLAPGVAGGSYDPGRHAFVNFSARQTADDLEWSLNFIRQRNPGVKFILTVSPVPLNATAVDRHVVVSTCYSKAALRVAAEDVSGRLSHTDYFPSYEIITGPHAGNGYFAEDRRSVTESGVAHVMRVFLRHYGGDASRSAAFAGADSSETERRAAARQAAADMNRVIEMLCDEEAIDNTD
ncbi:MAG: GSCFA domain-containing protein [Methylocystis sp.]|uniref:GSCFA domain-containing protein n=1 Tax=Methylocystis sp. TaxID=1911079 RepID=UPI003DA48E8E